MEDALYRGNREPSLDHILADPIVQTIMRRDGATAQAIRALLRHVARGVKSPEPPKRHFISTAPPRPLVNSETPQVSASMLAQAASAARWPRVFPSL